MLRNKLFHLFHPNKIVTMCSFGTNFNFPKWNIMYVEQLLDLFQQSKFFDLAQTMN